MKNRLSFTIVILYLMVAALFISPFINADKIEKSNIEITEDNYVSEMLIGLDPGEEIWIDVSVKSPSDAPVDVYILTTNEYDWYRWNGSFTPTVSYENFTLIYFKFTGPGDHNYFLVIDNKDNSRSADAIPSGTIMVDYNYDDPYENQQKEADALAKEFDTIIFFVLIILIAFTLFIEIIWRKIHRA